MGFGAFTAVRLIKLARSKVVERTGVQGFYLVTLHSASPDKAVVRAASIKGFEGFTLLLGRLIRLTSALNRISDVVRGRRHFSDGPQGDSCGAANNALFDHLVGTREQHGRNGEAERLRGP